jgi:hypothetical protein
VVLQVQLRLRELFPAELVLAVLELEPLVRVLVLVRELQVVSQQRLVPRLVV